MSVGIRTAGRAAFGAIACLCVAGMAQAAEVTSSLPLRSGGSFDWWSTAVKAIFTALICLAIVAVLLYRLKNRGWMPLGAPSTPAGATVEWARRVSPRTTLIVVTWQGKRYLLAENTATTQVIDTQPAQETQS